MQQINIVISGFTPYEGIDVNPAVLVPVRRNRRRSPKNCCRTSPSPSPTSRFR